ncbi:MAG: TIGR03643 family protein [Campylobacterales bacterium]|nr:TIGR03643 family protein [Campylobacterales bacterium]
MAWADRITFDEIQRQYGISENRLKKMMRSLIKPSSYKRWRKRVQGRKTKHLKCSTNYSVPNTL